MWKRDVIAGTGGAPIMVTFKIVPEAECRSLVALDAAALRDRIVMGLRWEAIP
jgi:hypothetical protein